MKASNRVIMNTGILYARMLITVFLSLYTTRVILDALGAEDFGIFVVVGSAIAMLTFLNAGMSAATQRFMSFSQGQGDENRQSSIFNVSIIIHVLISLAVVLILEVAGYVLFNGILRIDPARDHAAWFVYQCAVAGTFFTILSVPYDAVINAHENMLLFAGVSLIESILKLAVALYIVEADGDKLEIYGFLMATLPIVLLMLKAIYCHARYHECEISPVRRFDLPLLKEMTSFGGWSLLGSSTSMVANYGQGVVLNMFFPTVINAAQGVTAQVSGQLGAFASNMLRALNPYIVKSEGAGERKLMLKASMIGSKLSFFLLMLFYVPIIIEMPYLFGLWLKNVPEFTQIFCILLLIRNLVEQLFIALASSIAAAGKIKSYQIVMSILTILPLPISFLIFQMGMPPYGLYIVFLIYSMGAFVVTLYFSQKLCDLSVGLYFKDVVLRCIAALILTLIVSAIPLLLMSSGWLRLLNVIVLSLSAFSATVWWIGFGNSEREYVRGLIRSILRRFSF
jgi:O-antigen/teichoic acid export membrane protein